MTSFFASSEFSACTNRYLVIYLSHGDAQGEAGMESKIMNTQYLGKDQNWNNGSTTYWFEIDGESFGVVEGNCSGFVDCDGYPIGQPDAETADKLSHAVVTDEMRAE